ncbi:MAG: uracil-DNA glycosylase [Nevskiaceae bacterium]|jgi:uracil-DNA glycosylase|nr:uracil-DNA glycosylase [Nevskiaceae bacterium]
MNLRPFLRALQAPSPPHTFNPWRDVDPSTDLPANAPAERVARLTAHLNIRARFVLIGEASGYQGCKVSGIPFTSERLILEGDIPRVTTQAARLSSRPRPWSEPSATTVWGTLHDLGIADQTVLWNAFAWHPHRPGNPHTNRTPTPAERAAGLPLLSAALALFPEAQVLAVGRQAQFALEQLGVAATALRHPSMGGATQFRQQLRAALRRSNSQ